MSDTQQHNSGRRLGRGLSALLGGGAPAAQEGATPQESGELRQIDVSVISRNPFQPRKNFDAESLGELASSIKEHGVIQPIIVREFAGGFQLIAGERRWQAAQKAGLSTVTCRVVDVIDKTACEYAIEENLKRQDLNDLEKAQAFRDYIDQFGCTVEELSKQISMSRSSVANMLRLLDLSDPVKNALHSGRISAGHARAILPLEEAAQLELCGRVQAEKLNVRQTEAAVKAILKAIKEGNESTAQDGQSEPRVEGENPDTLSIEQAQAERTAHIDSLEAQLRDLLGVKVQIKLNSKDNGTITIPFTSNSEFERILQTVRRAA